MQFSDFCAQRGFWAITLVPDMLEGQELVVVAGERVGEKHLSA